MLLATYEKCVAVRWVATRIRRSSGHGKASTCSWLRVSGSSQFLYTRSKLLSASLTAPRPAFEPRCLSPRIREVRLALAPSQASVWSRGGRARWWFRLGALASGWRRVRLGVIVRWQAARLDRDLAAGVSPAGPPMRTRSAPRGSPGGVSRANLADGLAKSACAARPTPSAVHRGGAAAPPGGAGRSPGHRSARAPPPRPEPVSARGMAMLGGLLTEPNEPALPAHESGALGSRLRAAAAALEPGIRWD